MSNEKNTVVEATGTDNTTNATVLQQIDESQKAKRQKSLKTFNKKKRKKVIKTVLIVLIILAAIVFIAYKAGYLDKLFGKEDVAANTVTTYALTKQTAYKTITKVLTSTGTLSPNDQYTITALVNGEILADYFRKGDTVIEDQLLYEIESDSLDSNVTRARNTLKNAQTSLNEAYEKLEKLNVDTDVSGIIQKLHVEIGDEVNAGQLIADIVDKDTMILEIPFLNDDTASMRIGSSAVVTFIDSPEMLNGTIHEISPVTSISSMGATTRNVKIAVKNPGSITTSTRGLAEVAGASCTSFGTFSYNDEGSVYAGTSGDVTDIYFAEGSYISKGSILLKLTSTTLENQIESLEINVDNAQTSLDDALDAYDNYNITSPISGKVISKEYKQGDTIGGNSGNSQLAVIYDMSALKFTMSIDELDFDSIEEGQQVVVTCDSREGYTYYGTVTSVSIQGTTTNGTTVYPVEVTIENVEDESKRIVSEDGTVNKVYKTGMTSTIKDYSLESSSVTPTACVYTYVDGTCVKKVFQGDSFALYIEDKKLNKYTTDSYIVGTTVYSFSNDFSTMTVEERNEKKMLRPGMNVDAEIIVEKRENVLAIPVTAVGRGNTVKVLKNPDLNSDYSSKNDENTPKESNMSYLPEMPENPAENVPQGFDGKLPDDFKGFEYSQVPESFKENGYGSKPTKDGIDSENNLNIESFDASRQNGKTSRLTAYGTADANSEYETVVVTLGISDEEYVEIIDGLEIGDIIIIDNTTRDSSANQMSQMMGMGGGMGMMGGMPMGNMPSGMASSMPMGGGMPSGGGSSNRNMGSMPR